MCSVYKKITLPGQYSETCMPLIHAENTFNGRPPKYLDIYELRLS